MSLHAEGVSLTAVAAEFGTPTYCYAKRGPGRPLPGARAGRAERARLLRGQGQRHPRRDPHLRPPRRRRRHHLGRRAARRAPRRHGAGSPGVRGARQDAGGDGTWRSPAGSGSSTSNRLPSWRPSTRPPALLARARRSRSASTRTSMPRPTTRSPPAGGATSSGSTTRTFRRSTQGPPSWRGSSRSASPSTSARSSPGSRPSRPPSIGSSHWWSACARTAIR